MTIRTCLVVALVIAGARSAHADDAVPTPAPARRDAAPDASGQARPPAGIAVGVELGEPTSLTAGWFTGRVGAVVAIGSGSLAGLGVSARADLLVVPVVLVERPGLRVPLVLGIGVRHYRHGYAAMSVDEVPDAHTGVRVPVAIAVERGRLAFYVEIAPGYDVVRSDSCNFGSGVDTICPHAQSTRAFLNFALGTRWYLSN